MNGAWRVSVRLLRARAVRTHYDTADACPFPVRSVYHADTRRVQARRCLEIIAAALESVIDPDWLSSSKRMP